MVYSPMLKQALTTKAASPENFSAFVLEGENILRSILSICAKELNLTSIQKNDLIFNGIRALYLAPVFNIIIDRYNLPLQTTSQETKETISERVKAGMVRALLYVTLNEDQIDFYKDIVNEVLKNTPIYNSLNELNRYIQTKAKKCVDDFFTIERVGGTAHAPIYKALFSFEGYEIKITLEGSKFKVKNAVAEKWLAMYKSKNEAA